MCVRVRAWEHMSDAGGIGFSKRPDASASIHSCPPIMDNYQRMMALCHIHSEAEIKRPYKGFMWLSQPDETLFFCS